MNNQRQINRELLACFLREKREAAGFTQAQLAKILLFNNRESVTDREGAKADWKLVEVDRLAKAIGTTLSKLMADWEVFKREQGA